jgi:signal transduction histidine kinase/DNA-binding response OmpR family regulator
MKTTKLGTVQKRVWVVDDDETVLMLAEGVLSELGFHVEIFNDPAGALNAIAQRLPDIIILDVMMPGMNGFEFCSRLRANLASADVPVLMATSLEDHNSITQAYEAGATNFATKPLNWAVETHRLRYMLRVAESAQLLKAKEQETRLAKEDWERTFNSFSDVVTLLSPDLRVIRANLATVKTLKLPLEKIIGTHCYELFCSSSEPCKNCPILEAIRTGVPVSTEKNYPNAATDYLLTGTPVTDEEGRLLHVVHIARDQTEQKLLEREFLHAQKMEAMGTLAGGIAHDFNNLLMAISGCAEMIRDDSPTGGEQREFADLISESADRGAALSRQLLTFSRKGVAKQEKHPLRFNDLIRDLQKMLQRVFPKNITLDTRLEEDLALINGSADQLHQVLMNLAVNASHAMPGGGTLTFETRNTNLDAAYCRLHPGLQRGEYVQVSVTDTGHGIDQETIQRIYEPFFTTKQVGEGTGLGLAVVYGLVKDHGGLILCLSEVGAGTTFKLLFPVLKATGGTMSTPSPTKPARLGGNETLLIVDDEASIRTVVHRAFSKLGYAVIPANDGETALLRFNESGNTIRLVVMDLGMPGMGGWECLKRMRTINPRIPVLLTTGYGGQNLPERARQEGAVGLITKPYQLDEIVRTVRGLLDQARPDEHDAG